MNGHDKIIIHGIRVGRLAIKESALNSKSPGLLSTLMSFRDKQFGEWLPVWTWIIEHPEGTFLIDTGLSSDVNQLGYFKPIDFVSRYYFKAQMKFDISREEEIDHQLNSIGLGTDSIDKIVLTHLHIDHTGGMKHFPNIPIVVNKQEWKTKDGSFPKLFPDGLNINTVSLDDSFEGFDKCHFLTEDRDLIMIHTPGHTRGHVSIALLSQDSSIYLFGGDVSYSGERLNKKIFSSTIKSLEDNKESCNKILELAEHSKLVYLPTHDTGNIERLAGSQHL